MSKEIKQSQDSDSTETEAAAQAQESEAQDEEEEEFDPHKPLPPSLYPKIENLVPPTQKPLTTIFAERQQRLLVESLYASRDKVRSDVQPFVAFANMGFYYAVYAPPLVPDVMITVKASLPDNIWDKRKRIYFSWEYGTAPEVVVEIVTDGKGEEDTKKMQDYNRYRVLSYIIFDPQEYLKKGVLRNYALKEGTYELVDTNWIPVLDIGVTLWEGEYEGLKAAWLRWCDKDGNLLLTGVEQREKEKQRAEQAEAQVERLTAQLRELGAELE